MKLELKHLAPYLPYSLNVSYNDQKIGNVNRLSDINDYNTLKMCIDYCDLEHVWMFKPILRPMSDFDKVENDFDLSTDFEGCFIGSSGELYSINTSDKTYLSDMITVTDWLFENHFDVFGLIEKGLAIDINTLNNEIQK